MKMDTTK